MSPKPLPSLLMDGALSGQPSASQPLKPQDDVGPETIRGIPLPTLMMCACAVLRRSDDGAAAWYSHSKPVQTFSYFLSHSWKDGRFGKALGLTVHISRKSVIWVSSLIVLLVASFQLFDVVPLPSYTFTLPDGRTSTNGVSCLILGCVAWILYLALAPLLQSSEMWFLDKACICQTDAELKQQGIHALRTFLERSRTMVILLTPNYFSRGWCTFEIAAFLATRGIDAVHIVPLSRSALVMCAFGISLFAAASFHLSVFFGLFDYAARELAARTALREEAVGLLVFCTPPGMVFGIAFFIVEHYVAKKQRIVDQVKHFSMSTAEFTEEDDRIFVTEVIKSLFGTISRFEAEVHTSVYKKIERQLGSDRWQSIPYNPLVLGALPCLWWNMDMFCTDPIEMKLIDIFMGTSLTFILLPLLFAMFGVWAKVKWRLMRGTPVCLRLFTSAIASVAASCMGVVGLAGTLAVYSYQPWHISFIFWVLSIAATVAAFAELPPARRAAPPRGCSGGNHEEDVEVPILSPC